MSERGKYVVIEGIDGSGKTTQAKRLVKRMGGTAIYVREPGSTTLANQVRAIVLDSSTLRTPRANLYLFSAARADMLDRTVRPALDEGINVISDRNWLSTLAYQAGGEEVDESEILEVTRLAAGDLFTPDAGVFVDTPVSTSLVRLGGNPDYFERNGSTFYERIRQKYLDTVKNMGNFAVVNGAQTPDEVEAEIWSHLQPTLGQATDRAE